jgi:transposase
VTDYRTDTIGLDIGDKHSMTCVLDASGEKIEQSSIKTTKRGIEKYFSTREPCVVALEAGSHSRWIAVLVESFGHAVIIANPRELRLIYESNDKDDSNDAERLARLARVDPKLLKALTHRSEDSQAVLAVVLARDALTRARSRLVSHVRGTVKSTGERLPTKATTAFHKLKDEVPDSRRSALDPVMDTIEMISLQIQVLEEIIESDCIMKLPAATILQQPHGVGTITALAFVASIEDPHRFKKNRNIAGYLGLRPRRAKSSQSDPQLRITKAGNPYLRRLLVACAQRILGPFGAESDLRIWGLKLCERGGKNAKKRAVVAVARKLAVLLISLWKSEAIYEPLRARKGAPIVNQEPIAVPVN